jgi:hypothetical protein
LVFCALTKAIHKDLEENQVFQVRGFFKLGFCLVLEKQAIVWFSSGCLLLLQLTKWTYYSISFTICDVYSKEDLQTYRLYIFLPEISQFHVAASNVTERGRKGPECQVVC